MKRDQVLELQFNHITPLVHYESKLVVSLPWVEL